MNRIINGIKNTIQRQKQILELTKISKQINNEVLWGHIYHDSIRGKLAIENLSLNVGRWAGNYSFFYILNRILFDCKPKKILDLGLGESSKFISTYCEHYDTSCQHTIIEQDTEWLQVFNEKFILSKYSKVIHCPLTNKNINGFISNAYDNFDTSIESKYDLYIIDGPFGSERFSRYDLVNHFTQIDNKHEFIIVFDDTDRVGETDTLKTMLNIFKEKNINVHVGEYEGIKKSTIIATDKYRFTKSL